MSSSSLDDLHPQLPYDFGKAETKGMYLLISRDAPMPFLTATYHDNTEHYQLYASGRMLPGQRLKNTKADDLRTNTNLRALASLQCNPYKIGKVDYKRSTLLRRISLQ